MSTNIPQNIIDIAGNIRQTNGTTWQEIANEIHAMGYVDRNGNKYHNKALCIAVIQDPNWSHLRMYQTFSTNKRLAIITAMRAEGIDESQIIKVMKRI